MIRLLLILFLTFSFQTLSKADGISDFEIEGMSIGDSLLDYFTKNKIENIAGPLRFGNKDYFEWKKITLIKNLKTYEKIVLIFEADDKKYLIKAIEGRNYYVDNISECYDVQNTISDQIDKMILNANKEGPEIKKMMLFPNGSSYARYIDFILPNNSFFRLSCLDYSPADTSTRDRLTVMLGVEDYSLWVYSNVIK